MLLVQFPKLSAIEQFSRWVFVAIVDNICVTVAGKKKTVPGNRAAAAATDTVVPLPQVHIEFLLFSCSYLFSYIRCMRCCRLLQLMIL